MGSILDVPDESVKVVLEQMLEQAGRYSGAQILVWRRAPSNDEPPYGVGFLLDEFGDGDDRLPASIPLSFRSCLAWKKGFGGGDGFMDGHRKRRRVSASTATVSVRSLEHASPASRGPS